MRLETCDILQPMLEGNIDGRRGIGSKKKSWLRNIEEWTKKSGNTLIRTAQNSEEFTKVVADRGGGGVILHS